MSADRREHWEAVWRERAPGELSWHQETAERSFALITASLGRPDAAIIDVGGGDSPLTGDLARYGYHDLTVLDIADAALDHGRRRLGPLADAVTWITADVTAFRPERACQLWHDRAVFHFLTSGIDRSRYVEAAAAAVAPGGWLVIATFGPTGPRQCSGLPVQRHTQTSLTDALAPAFTPVEFSTEDHVTPAGDVQQFLYGRFRRS
ncbi:MAG: methyltransferase domain-containing protein [Acidimicrobiia bacterium]|nr:methyltransferase domain-containing protein [Acidimicrobiia bacterium]